MKLSFFRHLFITLLLSICSINAFSHDFEVDGIFYNIVDAINREVEVTFKGDKYNSFNEYINEVIIPSSVHYDGQKYVITRIGEYAFRGCSSLKKVTLGSNIVTISNSSFLGCYNINNIIIPNSTTSIGSNAFQDCYGLHSIVIGRNIENIGASAFTSCSNLKTIINLSSLNITKGATTNGNVALHAYRVISNITSIKDDFVFSIIEGVNTLVAYLGENTDILLPDSYEDYNYVIGSEAFWSNLNIKSITIPNSVTSIGDFAFFNCQALDNIIIPNSVTSIGNSAFRQCYKLKDINLPTNLVFLGNSVFYNCLELSSIVIPNNVPDIGLQSFFGCSQLKSITIGNSVTNIGRYAFHACKALEHIKISNSVTHIGEFAFNACTALTKIEIPSSVVSLGRRVFEGCINLKTLINFSSLEINISSNDNDSHMPSYQGQDIIKIDAPNGSVVDDFVFAIKNSKLTLCGYIGDKTELQLPINYKNDKYEIGAKAFEDYDLITKVVIPNGIVIGANAFCACDNLSNIVIGENIQEIGSGAFASCPKLSSVMCFSKEPPLCDNYTFMSVNTSTCKLIVPSSALETYKSTSPWSYFTNIEALSETITINQYGSGTYCSDCALDFSNVDGLKAYAATGYNSHTGVITLTRVMTAKAGVGLFVMGEPGEYNVPVMESTDDNSLNMLVGTLERTPVNGTSDDGLYYNYRYTIKQDSNVPLFYRIDDGYTLGAGKAYLQIPVAWLPTTSESRVISLKIDEENTTDIEEEEKNPVEQIYYDIMGRKVKHIRKGMIYIINGKKTIIN